MPTTRPLFIGHGSPMNALADNAYTRFLTAYGESIARPRAVVVISAHWRTRGTWITGAAAPAQIYDFYGFPAELYQLRYAPPGSPEIAQLLSEGEAGIRVDPRRGIDHAGWAVLKHLFPDGTVPLLELSLDTEKSEAEQFRLGARLARFRGEGILFLGSGNLVHNLGEIDFDEAAEPFPWALEADRWFKEKTEAGETASLIDYRRTLPDWQRSIPTDEHFLPLLTILGMQGEGERVRTLHEEIQNGSISMRSLELDAEPQARPGP